MYNVIAEDVEKMLIQQYGMYEIPLLETKILSK